MEGKPDWLPGFPVQIYCNRCDATMAEQSNPAMITETKINGVTYTVRSSFKEGCTETAVSKMAKVLKNELRGDKKRS